MGCVDFSVTLLDALARLCGIADGALEFALVLGFSGQLWISFFFIVLATLQLATTHEYLCLCT